MKNTPCQEKALKFIQEFLLDPNETECIISGQGGVGKTFVMNQVVPIIEDLTKSLDAINEKFPYTDVLRCATTNKAAYLVNGATLESTFGYRLINDFKTGKKRLVRGNSSIGNPSHVKNKIICIDEASMLGSNLRTMYLQDSKNCKFIYFMDSAQAVPVNSGGMAVLNIGLSEVEMTTPVRQGEISHLYSQCCKLRQAVFDQQTHFPEVGEDIKYITKNALAKYIKVADGVKHKILTYTNGLAEQLNHAHRKANGRKAPYEVGEVFISNSTVTPKIKSSVNKGIKNEDMCEIVTVGSSYEFNGIECVDLIVSVQGQHRYITAPKDNAARKKVQSSYFRKKDYEKAFALSDTIADLRPSAASTIHKAQGSTFDTVVIHVNDLFRLANYDQDTYRRLLFVAVSRARSKVYLYDEHNS